MLNNRDDDKFEGHEESEYHFSDEEVSYEADPEPVKTAVGVGSKQSLVAKLKSAKRLWIAGGVFLVLFFIVYKMVVPSTPVPVLDITAKTAPTPAQTAPVQPVVANPAAVATNPAPAAAVVANTPNLPPSGAAIQGGQAAMPAAPQAASSGLPAPGAMAQSQPTATAPAVIPVQSAVPTGSSTTPMMPSSVTQTTGTMYQVPGAEAADAKAASMAAERERLQTQFQAEYAQKVNDFSVQAKVLQDQIQTLTTRVAGLETQFNQLMQALARQSQGAESTVAAPPPPVAPYQSAAPKVAFSVQAIIPGRAWLKSDNGETVTVAEGDMVKDLGRITKIDPYDGVVEINTGTKVISLSYGNAG